LVSIIESSLWFRDSALFPDFLPCGSTIRKTGNLDPVWKFEKKKKKKCTNCFEACAQLQCCVLNSLKYQLHLCFVSLHFVTKKLQINEELSEHWSSDSVVHHNVWWSSFQKR
jgi:hypothetical protein